MGKGKKSERSGKAGKANKAKKAATTVPAVIAPTEDAGVVVTRHGQFDLEDPVLPDWVKDRALKSSGYPYDDTLGEKQYLSELTALQIELVKLQKHIGEAGKRLVALFEGRDAAGKGGTIFAMRENMNPRAARAVALPKPTDRERGQWYFQRYAEQLPASGELVLFDRSWYNRAGVEPVMGFCSQSDADDFLAQAPDFEKMLVNSGIVLFKFWLNIGREMQLKRFHERRHDPLKIWKLSPIDYAALGKWDEYTRARDKSLKATSRPFAPWIVVLSNDKRRARLSIIRHILAALDYPGKDKAAVGRTDPLILGGPSLLAG
jgi:polyphosphate kinase 2